MTSRLFLARALAILTGVGALHVVACSSSNEPAPHDEAPEGTEAGAEASVPRDGDAGLGDADADADADLPPPTYDFGVQCTAAPCVTQLAARGGSHACAVFQDRTVRCWGSNASGQLGTGESDGGASPAFDAKPRAVGGLPDAASVAATGDGVSGTTCVVATSGEVWCFGSDARGLLGRGGATSTAPHPEPMAVAGLAAKSVVLADTFALAMGTDGRLWSWGSNDLLQLARYPGEASANPTAPTYAGRIMVPVRSVAGTSKNGFVVTDDGSVLSWGGAVDSQLARASSLDADAVPAPVAVSDITSITTGAAHVCALSRGGGVFCWGDNAHGQLGIGTKGSQRFPAPVLLPDGVQAVAVIAGGDDTCIIAASGDLHCWGANGSGQIATAAGDQLRPRRIEGLGEQVISAAIMDGSICALRRGGSVECWGDNLVGQLGRGTRDSEIHVEPGPIVIE